MPSYLRWSAFQSSMMKRPPGRRRGKIGLLVEMGRIVDDQVDQPAVELLGEDGGHPRTVGLVDPVVGAHHAGEAPLGDVVLQGWHRFWRDLHRDELLGLGQLAEQHGAPAPTDAELDDDRRSHLLAQLDVALDEVTGLHHEDSGSGAMLATKPQWKSSSPTRSK
jgi:hypothetical protein